ncbi:MAG: VacJ family lipoprotein [Sulfurimonas sp.]|nr:VacJ family lipoprotein [Sulfurimonas sp.]
MRLIVSFFIVFIVVSFSGCSSKKIESPNEVFLSELNSEDEELDDFEDEFEVKEIYDPFSGYNRVMTSFNDNAYEYVLKPIANGYSYIFHEEIRLSVDKFFHNIYYPSRLVNNLLQGKFYNAYEETGRFVINSTVGLFGLFDPAKSSFNLQAHNEDFGQTLGFYGVGSGPHIVIPLLGPSNLRDIISLYPDTMLSVIHSTERSYWTLTDTIEEFLAIKSLEMINTTSLYMRDYEKLKADAVDLYPYLRDVYEQHRDKLIEE